MKKLIALFLALLMALTVSAAFADDNPYAVTEPITIEWWHSNEDQYTDFIQELAAQFHEEYPLITVKPVYIGSGTVLAEKLIAAIQGDAVPAVSQVNVSYLAEYFDSGVCTDLEPYFKAYGIDKDDFVKGYRKTATRESDGHMYSLPFLASTQVIYYNKTVVKDEGLTIPTKWEDMDAFMKAATKFNDDGTTARWAFVFGGWGTNYFETLFTNYGVEVIKEDGTCGLADPISIEITNQISLNSYMSNFLVIIFIMGVVFEIPLLAWVLSQLGLISRPFLREYRKHAVVVLLILAAVITPSGDPFTLAVVFIPLFLLYELAILVVRPGSPESGEDPEPEVEDGF